MGGVTAESWHEPCSRAGARIPARRGRARARQLPQREIRSSVTIYYHILVVTFFLCMLELSNLVSQGKLELI